MNILLLSTFFTLATAEMCMRLLRNHRETRLIRKTPGRIWRWNKSTQKFEVLEALKFNDGAVCSVDMAKDLTGKTIIVATDLMKPYVMTDGNDTGVTGLIGDIWNILEETLKFK